jgi:hypothetical protein
LAKKKYLENKGSDDEEENSSNSDLEENVKSYE